MCMSSGIVKTIWYKRIIIHQRYSYFCRIDRKQVENDDVERQSRHRQEVPGMIYGDINYDVDNYCSEGGKFQKPKNVIGESIV